MHAFSYLARISLGILLVSATGCFSYNPYGYGYGYGNQGYAVPPGGMAPSPVYPQGATLMPPTAVPGTATQAYNPPPADVGSYDGQLPKWQPSPQSAAPQGSGDAFGDSNGNNPVPDYRSPGDANSEPTGGDAFGDEATSSPFGEQSGVELQGIETQAQNGGVTLGEPVAAYSDELAQGDGSFAEPVPYTAVSTTRTLATNNGNSPNPYDYDRKNYDWLRGVVDFDERSRTWNLIYDLTPEADDEFGGSITLVDDPQLNVLRNEDVILVEGQIDETQRDELGKPKYRFEQFSRLVPKR